MSGYKLTHPCPTCPFRSDIPGYLNQARVAEIERALVQAEFPCHQTTEFDDEGEVVDSWPSRQQHCAGALILLEKLGRPSQMMRIAERLGRYDRTKLDLAAPVFASFAAMRKAQPPRRRRR